MTIILFILIFGLVVVSHEFGHYIVGVKSGIHVVEFALGMGPVIFHRDGKKTRFTIRLFPIGGACMFEGEDEDVTTEGAFLSAGVWNRFATVAAGPIFNFILAFLLSLILVGFTGSDKPIIYDVSEGGAAEACGIGPGDEIIRLGGERIHVYREVSLISMLGSGSPVDVEYRDAETGEINRVTLTPLYDEADGRYYFGFLGAGSYEKPGNPLELILYSGYEVGYWVKATYKSLLMLIKGRVSPKELSGPVGIATVVGQSYEETKSYGFLSVFLTMVNITVLLSVNLGIMNLLPLPALDGGRLVFIVVEMLRGKPVPQDKEGLIHGIGFLLFMLLAVVVMFNDIMRIIH